MPHPSSVTRALFFWATTALGPSAHVQALAAAAIYFALATLLFPAPVFAQVDATVSLRASTQSIRQGEPFRLQIQAEVSGAEAGEISLPNLQGLEVLGQRSSRPMQFSFGFGQRFAIQSSVVQELTLRATRAGTLHLEPASIDVGGKRFSSNPLTLEVLPADPAAGSQPPATRPDALTNPAARPEPIAPGTPVNRDGFLRVIVNKRTPFVGEQTIVSVYLYFPGNLPAAPQILEDVAAEGFWVQSLLPQNRTLVGVEDVVEGRPYQTYLLSRFAAFPLKAGTLTIAPPKVALHARSFFSLFGAQRNSNSVLSGNPSQVLVRPTPPAPEATGDVVVGDFTLDARIDRDQGRVGDPLSLDVTLRGDGNTKHVQLPAPILRDLRVLRPEISDTMDTQGGTLMGTRRWRFLVVPEAPGSYELPPFRLTRFDPTSERFETLTSAPLSFRVEGAPAEASATSKPPVRGTPVRPSAGLQLPAQRAHSNLSRLDPPLSSASWFPVALALPPLLLVLALALRFMTTARQRANAHATARRRHEELARLKEAAVALREGDARAFYRQAQTFLTRTLEEQLGQPIGSLTRRELRNLLVEAGTSDDLSAALLDELEGLDAACYSMDGSSKSEAQRCIDRIALGLEGLGHVARGNDTPSLSTQPGVERPGAEAAP